MGASPREHRFLLFSNEAVGLGHLRRTIAITDRLSRADVNATSLIVTGSPVQAFFDLPPRVEIVTLPTLTRDLSGRHQSRRLTLDAGEIKRLRSEIAQATAFAFRPDCVVVDRFPLGLNGELRSTLDALNETGCRLVLGLRDIEDDPAEVRRTWGREMRDAIRNLYDLVLVYGPSSPPLDVLDCLRWEPDSLPAPVVHVGYVGTTTGSGPDGLPDEFMLATVGGGSDGFSVLATFVEAVRLQPLPHPAVVVTGPLMPRDDVERLEALAEGLDVEVWRFRPDLAHLISRARAIVCMAGYNTVAEVMRARTPALLVPRVQPLTEQLLRARELERRGLQDVLLPRDLAPSTMRAAIDRLLARPKPTFDVEQFRGTERTADLLAGLVRSNGSRPAEQLAAGRR
jgi:predicted glycosyltransferase